MTPEDRRLRVLVVDDHADTALALSGLLQSWEYDVRTAPDGAAALGAFDEFRPTVALLDLALPDLSGYDVAMQLRDRAWRRRVFIVMVTGSVALADQRQATAAGISHYLVKPVNPEALKRILAAYRFAWEVQKERPPM